VKKNPTIIILFAVLGVLLLIYFIFRDDKKHFQWYESYNAGSDQPYGTLFIKRMLQSYRTERNFIYSARKPLHEVLDSIGNESTDYIFIGQSLHLNQKDAQALLDFIDKGNDAFIASIELPENITGIYVNECGADIVLEEHSVESATLNFYHDTLHTKDGYTYRYRFMSDDMKYYWNSFNNELFCDSTKTLIPLGYQESGNQKNINFLKFAHGKGNIYLYSNPLVFTNYFLTKPDKADYAAGVFSHLKGKNILWDEFSKVSFTGNNNPDISPLYFILNQPSLKYAWWMMLAAVVLYVLFAAKRTQRVIPVLEAKVNTSLEFVKLVSALHYQNQNHLDIARKKMKYFQYFIRARYGIHTQMAQDIQIARLAEKSKVNIAEIQSIYDQYNQIERNSQYNTAIDKLVGLYNAIENFYKHCK
jgi:hypothetical protein